MLQLFSTRKAHLDACILRRIVLIMLAWLALSHSGCAVTEKMSPPVINAGAGFFYFKDKATATGDAIRVFYYKPRGFTADRPVLFFMHGADRRAEHIPGAAAELLEKFNILLILPEFSEELFPGIESYQYGNVGTKPRSLWSFPVNDRIFRYVRQITGSHQQKYYVWGNSAGAQFVHRQILLGAHQYIEKAFASNAGVYTLPTNGDDPYPFSIKGLGLTNEELREVFSVDFFVLLGEQDLARDAYFLQSRPAMKQGGDRLQRGRLFYATAASEARGRGLDFNWTLITFPGCGHEPDDAMITKVISLILDSQN